MKKSIFLAAFAAMFALSSCQEDVMEGSGAGKDGAPVFKASILATKTSVNVADGVVSWESGDVITVTDAAGKTATYSITSIEPDGTAIFEKASGDAEFGTAPFTATYGTAPSTAQAYSATVGKLYMEASETSTSEFTFEVKCGLLKINLTKSEVSVKSVAVTGVPTDGSRTTYTLTCNDAQSIASGKDFFIAVPAGKYTKIEIMSSSDLKCTKVASEGITVPGNAIIPVTFGSDKLDFITPDALPGLFSVGESKQVRFSKGNLTYNVSTQKWAFYDNQYDKASGERVSETLISLFTWGNGTWSTTPNTSECLPKTSDGDSFGEGEDWGSRIQGWDWYTLSKDEWSYLLGRENSFAKAQVNGVNGVVLIPDAPLASFTLSEVNNKESEYSSNVIDAVKWAEMQDGGYVFLPAAGASAFGNINYNGTIGYYWSSTYKGQGDPFVTAYDFEIQSNVNFGVMSTGVTTFGGSVRLVTSQLK